MQRKLAHYKLRPGAAKKVLSFSSMTLAGTNTVQQLCALLSGYIGHSVGPTATIDGLGIDPNMLATTINGLWHLPTSGPGSGYRPGELQGSWTVQELADDIDKRVAAAQKAGQPAGHA